ncbi:hypothetical protein BC938DRAFT_476249 [Jimgerdemannia flammicorona]|uniref:Uncharacterized protein n=1 Tax=Jimgerdemannia flammicorona TaxID=994334 RepID=A0A433QQQ7_9FUNG|nr:hypothetical protein BC938DRAFT_476249 [Jimgerdemannia flammicorona]
MPNLLVIAYITHMELTGDGNSKVVAVLLADVLDQIDCVGEAVFHSLPVGSTPRGVTTEGKDILAPAILGFLFT